MANGTIKGGPTPVAEGGTGATTAAAAREELGAANVAFEQLVVGNLKNGKTLTFSGTVFFLLVTGYSVANRHGMWIVFSTSTGTATITPVVSALGVTVTAETGKITVTTGAYDCSCSIIPLTVGTRGYITIS